MDNFIEMARSHRQRYLPSLCKRLEQAGALEAHLASVAQMAEEELLELVTERGMRQEEALQMVLPKYILIPPEEAKPEPLANSEADIPMTGGTIG